ncbi:hypothetical protein HMPREF1979_03159 [Actinomyces johnsonii F0542]|uniref:Uncharacterized protein n=1 Tax=Actinomyces johnsonii F0542 TaxID=1321818 RepID=U1QG88_9ACTO|nr:hypothetical protein HMPREF1979_03159 [Actinomyces johnsonii F0542]
MRLAFHPRRRPILYPISDRETAHDTITSHRQGRLPCNVFDTVTMGTVSACMQVRVRAGP